MTMRHTAVAYELDAMMCVVPHKFMGEELTAGEEVHSHTVLLRREQNDSRLLGVQTRFSL